MSTVCVCFVVCAVCGWFVVCGVVLCVVCCVRCAVCCQMPCGERAKPKTQNYLFSPNLRGKLPRRLGENK